MNSKLNEIIQKNRFQFTVTVPTVVWLLIFILFISFWVGWRNLFDLLPHEIAIVFLALIMPILLMAIIYIVLCTMADVRQVASNFQQHAESIKTPSDTRRASSRAAETKDQ